MGEVMTPKEFKDGILRRRHMRLQKQKIQYWEQSIEAQRKMEDSVRAMPDVFDVEAARKKTKEIKERWDFINLGVR